MRKSTSGFTIVELLIVIVVIAILATISVVAYTGAQQRARNTARISAANSAVKLVRAYIASEGKYPPVITACVGTGFPENKCGNLDASPVYTSASLDAALKKVGSLPQAVLTPVNNNLGPVYNYWTVRTVNGESHPILLIYQLEGQQQNCGLNNIVGQTSDVDYPLNPTGNYTSSSGGMTTCYASILDTP